MSTKIPRSSKYSDNLAEREPAIIYIHVYVLKCMPNFQAVVQAIRSSVHKISKLKEFKTLQAFAHVENCAPTDNSSDDRKGNNL